MPQGNHPGIIVYTNNFLGYDDLTHPVAPGVEYDKSIRFIRFTDQAVPYDYRGWENVRICPEPGTEMFTHLWLKTHTQSLFPVGARTIFVNACLYWLQCPAKAWEAAIGDGDIARFPWCHPTDIYTNAVQDAHRGSEDLEITNRMLHGCTAAGVPEDWIIQPADPLFRRNNPRVWALNGTWWDQLMLWGDSRDQTSLAYALWKQRGWLEERHLGFKHWEWVAYYSHKAPQGRMAHGKWKHIKRHPTPDIDEIAAQHWRRTYGWELSQE